MMTTVEQPRGMRCQEIAEITGERCKCRSFALLRIVWPDGHFRNLWLCSAHQARLRKAGCAVHLVHKWRQQRD